MLTYSQLSKFGLVTIVAVSLAACQSSGSYRLASVGTVPGTGTADGGDGSSGGTGGSSSSSGGGGSSGGSSGGTASSGGSSSSSSGGARPLGGAIIVTAGNAVIGVAGKQAALTDRLGNKLPLAPVTGTVTKVLIKTGQTLVDIGNGNTLILGKAGGKIGDLLKIDVGSKTVIGAPNGSPLLGVGVLSPAGSGNLATATVGKTVNVVVGVTKPLTTTVTGAATPQTGATTGTAAGVGGVVNKTTGAVGGLLGGLKPKK